MHWKVLKLGTYKKSILKRPGKNFKISVKESVKLKKSHKFMKFILLLCVLMLAVLI